MTVSMGIPGIEVDPGTHICALYSGRAERDRLLFPFLKEGIREGDKCLCLIDDAEPAEFATALRNSRTVICRVSPSSSTSIGRLRRTCNRGGSRSDR